MRAEIEGSLIQACVLLSTPSSSIASTVCGMDEGPNKGKAIFLRTSKQQATGSVPRQAPSEGWVQDPANSGQGPRQPSCTSSSWQWPRHKAANTSPTCTQSERKQSLCQRTSAAHQPGRSWPGALLPAHGCAEPEPAAQGCNSLVLLLMIALGCSPEAGPLRLVP